ncbi:beta-1,3-galactosyltransferase 1-like [Denticeps clupeoides]|uniref:Hexosyltransferase n=1 Tax=Denticeps clupeoides TaxID=299321 RepID=A0AAY4AAI7_9TELE|nr:beta-1,3-galactosyltransferase 1-like [Denticeps clupeoides]
MMTTNFNHKNIQESIPESRPPCKRNPSFCFIFLLILSVCFIFYFYTYDFSTNKIFDMLRDLQNSTPATTTDMPTAAPTLKSLHPYFVEYPHKYDFIVNEEHRCQEEITFLALMVPVAPNDHVHREVIRKTWGSERVVLGKNVTLFFLLGLPSGEDRENMQQNLLLESAEHHDLLQSDFVDSYNNLTIKTMVMLEWLNAHCPKATFAMKIDSDAFLNVPNLVKLLLEAPHKNYITGLVRYNSPVVRNTNSKWYVPEEVFAEPVFPPNVLGLGYVFSTDLCSKLVEAAQHVRAVYIEDVYIGMCLKHLGILPTYPPNWSRFYVSTPEPYNCSHYPKLILSLPHNPSHQENLWKNLQSQQCS